MNHTIDVAIRPLAAAYQSFLWEMVYQAIFVLPGEPAPDRAIVHEPALAQYAEGFGREGDFGYLAAARAPGHALLPIGAAWLRHLPGGYGYIDHTTPELSMAVLPPYRGRGVGSMLLGQLITGATGRYPAISLSVQASNPALRLYQRFGFDIASAQGEALTLVLALPTRTKASR